MQVADLANADPSEVIFTSGATESNNLALMGLAEHGIAEGRMHILVSAIEHKSVLETTRKLGDRGFEVEFIPVGKSGAVNVADVLTRVKKDTLLVSVMHVNNETGTIQPVREIGEQLHADCPHVIFHVDAAQSFGKLVDEVRDLEYDLLSVTAHKMYGPQGIGALVTRKRGYTCPPLSPTTFGGGQERGLRSGTLPVALIAGFGKACELCSELHEKDFSNELEIRVRLLRALAESGVTYKINTDLESSVPSCLNLGFEGVSSEAMMIATRNVMAISNGSACTSNSYEPSYVLRAMGLCRSRAKEALRISWGRMSTETDATTALHSLIRSARSLQ